MARRPSEAKLGMNNIDFRQRKTASFQYYKKTPWDRWWTEFCISREKNGRMTYITAWQFAKAKAKNRQEELWIWECIGPKPIQFTGRKGKRTARQRLPYLGDWQELRGSAYFYNQESLDKMKEIAKQRVDGLEASRGCANLLLELITENMKYNAQVDDYFDGGQFLNKDYSRAANEKRAKFFLSLKGRFRKTILELMEQYMLCNGVAVDDLGQMVSGAIAAGTRASGAGGAGGSVLEVSPALRALNEAVLEKCSIFKMPLPAVLLEEEKK